MPRPSKRSALVVLNTFELVASSADKKATLIDTLARSKSASFEHILDQLQRTELEDICRDHGLDDAGRAKQPIIERTLDRDFGVARAPRGSRRGARPISELDRSSGIFIVLLLTPRQRSATVAPGDNSISDSCSVPVAARGSSACFRPGM